MMTRKKRKKEEKGEKGRRRSVQECIQEKAKGGSGMGDEGSSKRTLVRLRAYKNAAKEFVKVFTEDGRLITINIQSGVDSIISAALNEFLCNEYDFKPKRGSICSIVFVSSPEHMAKVDAKRYSSVEITLAKDLEIDQNLSLSSTMKKLTDYLDSKPFQDLFVIDISGTILDNEDNLQFEEPATIFLNDKLRSLEQIIPGYLLSEQKEIVGYMNPCYTTVTSGENQIFVFHKDDPLMTPSFRTALGRAVAFNRITRWKNKHGLH